MTLRRRAILLIVAMFAAGAIGFTLFAGWVVNDGFDDLLLAESRSRVERVLGALDAEAAQLAENTADLGTSIGAHEFMTGQSLGFAPGSLGAPARASLDVDVAAAVTGLGPIRWLDTDPNVPSELTEAVRLNVLRLTRGELTANRGLLVTPNGVALVVAQLVTGPDRSTVPAGALVFLRHLDEDRMAALQQQVDARISFTPSTDDPALVRLPAPAALARAGGADPGPEGAATAALRGTGNWPVLDLVAAPPPELVDLRGATTQRLLTGLLVGVGLGAVVLLLWFERRLLSRLSLVTSLVRQARGAGRDRPPVEVEGDDELSELATTVEQALTSLERARRKLSQSNADLERANRMRDEFVSMISHELRTPLTAIQGFTATLRQHADTLPPETVRQMLARISSQSKVLAEMVDDLLTLTTLRAGGLEPERKPVAVLATVQGFLDDLPGPDAVTVRGDAGAVALVDPDHLRRIVTNYLDNAFKYGEPPVTIEVTDDAGSVRVAVVDGGPGVPEHFTADLFDQFTQASRGDTRTASGVGLGLSIVTALADANGGRAFYERREGRTCFAVELAVPTARHQRAFQPPTVGNTAPARR